MEIDDNMSEEIITRLTRIETMLESQTLAIGTLKKHLHGNGREGICDRVTKCEDHSKEFTEWINTHEKNIRHNIGILVAAIAVAISVATFACNIW